MKIFPSTKNGEGAYMLPWVIKLTEAKYNYVLMRFKCNLNVYVFLFFLFESFLKDRGIPLQIV